MSQELNAVVVIEAGNIDDRRVKILDRAYSQLWDASKLLNPIDIDGRDEASHRTRDPHNIGEGKPKRKTENGAVGARGSNGSIKSAETAERQNQRIGKNGSRSIEKIEYCDIYDAIDDNALEILMIAFEEQFRMSQDINSIELKDKIEYLLSILNSGASDSGIRFELLARAYAHSRKIELGLDYYGHSKEFAPLGSFDLYSTLIDRLMPAAREIENQFNLFCALQSDRNMREKAARAALDSSYLSASAIEGELEREISLAKQLLNGISVAEAKMKVAMSTLMLAKEALDAAIERQSSGCNLVSSLTAVATIVAGVSTGGVALIGAASAGAKLFETIEENKNSIKEIWDSREQLQKNLKEIGKEAQTFSESVKVIRKSVEELSADEVKKPQFVMEKEKFDDVAKQFADLEEAKLYRNAGYEYLGSVEARNNSIIEYNCCLTRAIEKQTFLLASKRATNSLQTALSANFWAEENYISSLMMRLYRDTLSIAANMVSTERKALDYLIVRRSSLTFSALSISSIQGAHQKTVQDWLYAKENYRAIRQLAKGRLTTSLRSVVDEQAWTDFCRMGLIGFTLRPDHEAMDLFAILPGLKVTGLEIEFVGIDDIGRKYIPWNMSHCGTEQIFLSSGIQQDPLVYTHNVVSFTGTSPLDGGVPIIEQDFAENGIYSGVSPFATWLLKIVQKSPGQINLSSVEDVIFKWSGYYVQG